MTQRQRLFANEWLERLTIMRPRTFVAVWSVVLPAIAWAGWNATQLPDPELALSASAVLVRIMLGLLCWTLFEYAMHRFLFHWQSDQPLIRRAIYVVHGNHHDDPVDPLRGLMPLIVSLPVGGLIWLALVTLFGAAGTWVFLGFMCGYVIYDFLHFACHQWPMSSRLGQSFKRHHMRHHHHDERGNFAISALFWDRVFGTRVSLRK